MTFFDANAVFDSEVYVSITCIQQWLSLDNKMIILPAT